MKCIYCNTEENLTSSDIITYAITGAKLVKTFVCKTHNAFTNDNYEKKFVSDMDFFRNQLGLSTRDGKPIQYIADITVDGTDIHGVKISNRKALFEPKTVVAGTDNEGKKVLMAPVEKLKKIGGSHVDTVDISDVTLHKTISSDDFVGFYATHSIAKMAYEWYCYIHNIEEYREEYKDIVGFILGDDANSFVDIIADGGYYGAIDRLSEIGTNIFFEYDDLDGYRYVIFDLWKTISYRIRICKSPKYIANKDNMNYVLFDLYLYRLDGSKAKTMFGVAQVEGNRKFKFITVRPEDITLNQWKPYVKRIEKIMTTMVLSIHILKRDVESLANDLEKYNNGKINVAQLLEYEENNIATVLEVINLLYVNKDKYDKTKSFNENLGLILQLSGDTITRTREDKKALISSLLQMDKIGTLFEHINNRISTFNDIYEIEIERIRENNN